METPNAVFQPSGAWSFKANTPTIVDASHWSNITGDPSADASSFFSNDGKLVAQNAFSLEIQACIDLDDFPAYTGSMIVQAVFNPGPLSKSGQYIICSLVVTQDNKRVIMSNQVPTIKQGDQIYLNFLTSADLDATISSNMIYSIISYRDCTTDDTPNYWVTRSGYPPQMTVYKNKVINMVATDVTNGVAKFILTQDGTTTGESMFPNLITSAPMTLQSTTTDQTLTPASWFYLPFAVGNQSITAIFSDKTNNRWSAICTVTGR